MEWISVKDRLPKKSGYYIVCCKSGYVTSVCYSAKKSLFNSRDEDNGEHAITDVTHWMLLPEPPVSDSIYDLYKYVNGEWCYWGTYDDPVRLAYAANDLGQLGFGIKVEVVEDGMDKR